MWVLPWPPVTVNHLYGRSRSHVWLNAAARRWRDEVVLLVRRSPHSFPPHSVPLSLTLWLYPPDRRRRDADGVIKLTQDALFSAFGEDDVRVAELHVFRMAPNGIPRIVAVIAPSDPNSVPLPPDS